MKQLRIFTTALLCALLPMRAFSQSKKVNNPPKKAATQAKVATAKPVVTTAVKPPSPAPTAPVATTVSQVTATASQPTATPGPVGSSSFFGNSPLQTLYKRLIQENSTKKRTPIGNVGVGINLFTSGSITGGIVLKKPAYYITLGAGMFANKTTYAPTNDPVFYAGGGIPLKDHVKLGAILT